MNFSLDYLNIDMRKLMFVNFGSLSVKTFIIYILGIQQWRLDSDSGTPGFSKKDEIDSFQNVPGIKVSYLKVLAVIFCLTNKESLTVLCSVGKLAGSGHSMKDVGGNMRHS